jgi:hypothetical protein
MTTRVDDLVARYFPARPSRLPARLTIIGAVLTVIGAVLLFGTQSTGGMIAGVAGAALGLLPLCVGGVLWLRQRAHSCARAKSILLSGSYQRVERTTIAVMMGSIEVNRARVVRVYALRGRVIDLPVPDADAHIAIAALREHMSTTAARRA